MRVRLLTVLMVLIAAGCQPAPAAPSPAVTAQVLQVDLTSSLRDLGPLLSDCARRQETLGLVINEQPTPGLDAGSGPARLRWGAPAGISSYAAVLAEERLVVVVHPANALSSLTRDQLRAIYSGSARNWDDLPDCESCAGGGLTGKEIHAWAYAPGEDIQQIFESALGQRVTSAAAGLVPHPQAALEAVAGDAQAIGFVPARLLDESVRALAVEDIAPDLLSRPILALSPSEPQGLPRQWLSCAQEKLAK